MTGHVYVMQSGSRRGVKVGFSNNPELRAKALKCRLVHVTSLLTDPQRVENLAHRILSGARTQISAEWFNVDVKTAKAAIATAIEQHDGKQLCLGSPIMGTWGDKPRLCKPIRIKIEASVLAQVDAMRGRGRRAEVIRELLARGIKE